MKTAMMKKFNDNDRLQEEGQIDQWDIKSTGDGDPELAFKRDSSRPNKSQYKESANRKGEKDSTRKMLKNKSPSTIAARLKASSHSVYNKTNKKKSKAPIIIKPLESDNSLKGLDEVDENKEDVSSVFKNKLIRDMQEQQSDSARRVLESSDN